MSFVLYASLPFCCCVLLNPRLGPAAVPRTGKEITVQALAYTMAGHELHHRTILKERYRLR